MELSRKARFLTGSAIREIFKYTSKPGMISFAGGNPGAFALPNEQIALISQELLLRKGKELLQYGQTPGYLPLRESVVEYVKDVFGLTVKLEEVLITTGSMQGLDLLCRTLLDPEDVVLAESPCFLGALQALSSSASRVLPVPCDEEGLCVDALEELMRSHRPKMLYTIPTFQNPTGTTLSDVRRKRVAELAAKYQVLVVEDDPYRELRYQGEPIPPIKCHDRTGSVALLGSFSKVIAPGLRVGFMVANTELIDKCQQFKQCMDVHTPLLNQAIVDHFLREAMLKPHLHEILPVYALSLQHMLDGLENISQIESYTRPHGGLFVFASLKEGFQADSLFKTCIENGVAFVPGEPFYPEGSHTNTMRLNFSNATPAIIDQGMHILAQCAQQL